MRNRILIAFSLILFFISCKRTTDIDDYVNVFDNSVNTFKREIPLNKDGKPDIFYVSAKLKQSQVGLENLENGVDGLQIRVWYDLVYVNKQKVVVISYDKKQWMARVYYVVKISEEGKKKQYSEKADNLIPKSGWAKFLSKLLPLQILTLPDGDSIQNCGEGGGDGSIYHVEIASKKRYRFYSYWEPEEYRTSCKYAKKMSDILKLLEYELGK